MKLRDIRTLWAREFKAALRERNLVIYTVLVPLTLYPVMIWAMLTGLSFVEGQVDDQPSRVMVVADDGVDGAAIADALASDEKIVLQSATGSPQPWLQKVRDDALDLVVFVHAPPGGDGSVPGNVAVDLHFDGSDDLSAGARERVAHALQDYRTKWLQTLAADRSVSPDTWRQYDVVEDNTASDGDMGGFLLGLIAPATMIVMIAIGVLYPAIDTVAGERERSTWETSLTLGVSRGTVIVAKYLYVATMGTMAGLLNLLGITAAMAMLVTSSQLGDAEASISLPLSAIPVIVLGTIMLALLIAALCMTVVPFARTFKEGQSLASPVFMLVLIPVMVAQTPLDTVALSTAAVPIANIMLVFRMVLGGALPADFAAVAFATTLAVIAACLWLATRVTKSETLMVGAFEESPFQMLKKLLRGKGAS